MSNKSQRKVEVTEPSEIHPSEIEKAQDFTRIITRFDEAKKPLHTRRLYQYSQRWFFIALIIIVLIIMMILGLF